MRATQYVVYFNQETASTATHKVINKEKVAICKPVNYFRNSYKMMEVCPLIKEWKVEQLYLRKYVFT